MVILLLFWGEHCRASLLIEHGARLFFAYEALRSAVRGKIKPTIASARCGERFYNNLRPASDSEISFSNRFCLVSSFFPLITHQLMRLR